MSYSIIHFDPSEPWIAHKKLGWGGGNLIFPRLTLHPMQHSSLNALRLMLQCHPHQQVYHHHERPLTVSSTNHSSTFTLHMTASKHGAHFSLKVVQATVRGKPDFQPTRQVCTELTLRLFWGQFANGEDLNTLLDRVRGLPATQCKTRYPSSVTNSSTKQTSYTAFCSSTASRFPASKQ